MARGLLIVFTVLVAALGFVFWWLVIRTVPIDSTRATLVDLSEPVLISFDNHAVPYIEAASELDLFEAQGYISARDRLFQMDLMRRAAQGNLSGVLGTKALTNDRFNKQLGIQSLCQAEFKNLDSSTHQALEAYCKGVNAFINHMGDKLPVEFSLLGYKPEIWQPSDSLSILKYHAFQMDESWQLDDLRQRIFSATPTNIYSELFIEDKNPNLANIACPRIASLNKGNNQFWGSTAYVLSPKISQSHAPITVCDKHAELTTPSCWYLCSLKCPSMHVAGASMPGVPGIIVGRNENISWASASLRADVQDIFLEDFNFPRGDRYRTDKNWISPKYSQDLIPVRFGKSYEQHTFVTRHGPVIFWNDAKAISLAWTGFNADKPVLNAVLSLNKAHNWEEFQKAMSLWSSPAQVFIYADTHGNTGLQAAGIIPVRAENAQGTGLNTGWQRKGEWSSYIAFTNLPSVFIPANSATKTANFFIAANQNINSSSLIGHQWCPNYRAERLNDTLTQFIKAKKAVGLKEISGLQNDEYSSLSKLISQSIAKAIENTKSTNQECIKTSAMLSNWNNQLNKQSAAATIYKTYLVILAKRLLEPKLGRDMTAEYMQRWAQWPYFVESILKSKNPQWLPLEERTYDTFLLTTLTETLKELKSTFYYSRTQEAAWQWGKVHTVTFSHVLSNFYPIFAFLNIGPYSIGADENCLNAFDAIASQSGKISYAAQSGTTLRSIVDMSDADKFYQSIAPGQSEHPASKYHESQIRNWLESDMHTIAFSDQRLKEQAREKMLLTNRHSD